MSEQKQVPRLGVASLVISVSDADGMVVRHGFHQDHVLASKPAAECSKDDWNQLWDLFEKLGLKRHD